MMGEFGYNAQHKKVWQNCVEAGGQFQGNHWNMLGGMEQIELIGSRNMQGGMEQIELLGSRNVQGG